MLQMSNNYKADTSISSETNCREWELVDSSPEALQTARESVRTFSEVQNATKQVPSVRKSCQRRCTRLQ